MATEILADSLLALPKFPGSFLQKEEMGLETKLIPIDRKPKSSMGVVRPGSTCS